MTDNQVFREIRTIQPRLFIGKSLEMSFANDTSFEFWRSFMPKRHEIKHRINSNLYSIQMFNQIFEFNTFDPEMLYRNWAAVEVSQISQIPVNMEKLEIKGGLYAVFVHKGTKQMFINTLVYIHKVWLPKSGYLIDLREHFQILTEAYKPDSPDSEEEVWVPVKKDNPSE